jgi:NAD(P)-dependent dehydrogenase (short-subunit alcohol dehydrogenase family)
VERVAFVTGCSSGIGRAAAIRFAHGGYNVIATARHAESLNELAELGDHVFVHACDIADDGSVRTAVAAGVARFGRINVVINNAGYAEIGPVEMVPLDRARLQFEVNTLGAIRVINAVAPHMRAQGGGRIINVSSIAGRALVPLAGWYTASKFALEALNDALRFELGPQGIDVISILPGPVLSDFMRKLHVTPLDATSPLLYRMYMNHYETRRSGARAFAVSPEQVAALIVNAATVKSPRARYYITVPSRVFNLTKKFIPDKTWDWLTKRAYGFDCIDRSALRKAKPDV